MYVPTYLSLKNIETKERMKNIKNQLQQPQILKKTNQEREKGGQKLSEIQQYLNLS